MIATQLRASDSWFNPPIAFITHSPWQLVHADIVLPDGRLLGSNICPGEMPDGKPVKSGVAIRPFNYGKPVRTLIVRYECTPEQAKLFYDTALALCGVKFGWSRLFALAMPYESVKPWTQAQGFFCSELVAYCLKMAGILPFNPYIEPSAITPRDLMTPNEAIWDAKDIVWLPANAGFWCK